MTPMTQSLPADPQPTSATLFWKLGLQMIVGLSITFLFLYLLAPLLLSAFLGIVLAVVSFPLFTKLQCKLSSSLSALLVTSLVVLGILVPLFLILFGSISSMLSMAKENPVLASANAEQVKEDIFQSASMQKGIRFIKRVSPVSVDEKWLQSQGMFLFNDIVKSVQTVLVDFLAQVPRLLFAFLIVIICLFFFLVDGEKLVRYLAKISPWNAERSQKIFDAFEISCRGVILGFVLSGFAQGTLVFLFFLFTKLPNPLLIGALTVVMGMIPVFGGGGIMLAGVVFALTKGNYVAAGILTVGSALVSVSDNIVRAWVMKGQQEMHPLLALLSALGAIQILGPIGIFLGPIVAGVFLPLTEILSEQIGNSFTFLLPKTSASPA